MKHQQADSDAVGWNVCILYASGQEKVLWSCRNREVALRSIDALYCDGYPLHFAYVIRKMTSSSEENIQFYASAIARQLRLKSLLPLQTPAWYS